MTFLGASIYTKYQKMLKGVPPADENGDIGTSDRVGQDESVGTN